MLGRLSQKAVRRQLFNRLVAKYPTAAIVGGAMKNILAPEFVDGILEEHARRQCERQLLFSTIVEMVCLVVCRLIPTISASDRILRESIPVSVMAVYNKINNLEPEVSYVVVGNGNQKEGQRGSQKEGRSGAGDGGRPRGAGRQFSCLPTSSWRDRRCSRWATLL